MALRRKVKQEFIKKVKTEETKEEDDKKDEKKDEKKDKKKDDKKVKKKDDKKVKKKDKRKKVKKGSKLVRASSHNTGHLEYDLIPFPTMSMDEDERVVFQRLPGHFQVLCDLFGCKASEIEKSCAIPNKAKLYIEDKKLYHMISTLCLVNDKKYSTNKQRVLKFKKCLGAEEAKSIITINKKPYCTMLMLMKLMSDFDENFRSKIVSEQDSLADDLVKTEPTIDEMSKELARNLHVDAKLAASVCHNYENYSIKSVMIEICGCSATSAERIAKKASSQTTKEAILPNQKYLTIFASAKSIKKIVVEHDTEIRHFFVQNFFESYANQQKLARRLAVKRE